MNKKIFRNLLVGTASAFFLCLSSEVSVANTTDYWKQFRDNYPFHFQSLLISKPSSGGKRTLIISEPPPHFLPSNAEQTLKKAFGSMYAGFEERKHPIGFNGWVRDYIVTLIPPIDASAEDAKREVKDGIAALTYMLHGTSYKAHAFQLPVDKPQNYFNAPENLSITPGEIKSWISDPSQIFRSVDTSQNISLNNILDTELHGVFISKQEGLVLLVIPRNIDLKQKWSDLRKFSLDSDLILGAFTKRNDESLVIVGRERQSTLRNMPPLRPEIMLALAATNDKSLGQSYERTHILAGKILKGNLAGKDWAPIFLSKDLIDTELGSLLNITDQILKSWSLSGNVQYENTPYPKPQTLPFGGKSLTRLMNSNNKVTETLFNWNTSGLGAIYDFTDHKVLAFANTGSLPITYGSDILSPGKIKIGNLSKYEKEAYSYFSKIRNSHLTRAAQYSSLYQIFAAFPIEKVTWSNESSKKNTQKINKEITFQTYIILKNANKHSSYLLKGIKNASQEISKKVNELNISNDSKKKLKAENRKTQFLLEASIKFGNKIGKSNKILDKNLLDLAILLSEDKNIVKTPKLLASSSKLKYIYKDLFELLKNNQKIINQISISSRYEPENNIKTPTIVVSKNNPDPSFISTGGHNIDSQVTHIISDPSVSKNDVDIIQLPNKSVEIRINPEDANRSSSLAISFARGMGKTDLEKRLKSDLSNNQSPRSISKALNPSRADGTPGLSQSEIPNLDVDSASVDNSSLQLTNEQLGQIKALTEAQNLDLYIKQTADGYVIYRGYPPGFLNAQSPTALIEVLDSGFAVRSGQLYFEDFSEGSVEGIKQTLAARSNNSDSLAGRENFSFDSQSKDSNFTFFGKQVTQKNSESEVLWVSRKQNSSDTDTDERQKQQSINIQKFFTKKGPRLSSKPNWSQGQITRKVDESNSRVDYQVNLPVSQDKPIDLQIKATSKSRWAPTETEAGQNIIQNTLINAETEGKTLEEGIVDLRRELNENLQPKSLEFFLKESAGDFTIIHNHRVDKNAG